MRKISSTPFLGIFFTLLVLALVAKLLALLLVWFLPHDGVSHQERQSYQPPYVRYDLSLMLQQPKAHEEQKQQMQAGVSGVSITNMILKALFGKGESGVVIVALKKTPKESEVIGVGESFEGYKLKTINVKSAVFEKGGVDYILEMSEDEKSLKNLQKAKTAPQRAKEIDISKPLEVSKKDIAFYAKNPQAIWKQIAIGEKREDGQIVGFEVRRIDPKSPFAALGLQKGDLIVKANNKELKSYKDAIEIYQKIDTLTSVQIVFMRNNQEMEIVYEVH